MDGGGAVDVLVEVPEEVSCVLARGGDHRFVNMHTSTPLLVVGTSVYEGVLRTELGTNMGFDKSGTYVGGSTVRVVFSKRAERADLAEAVARVSTGKGNEK